MTAVLTSNLKTSPRPIVIQGSKGTITLKGKASHPDGGFVFTDLDGKTEDFDYPAPKEGTGMVSSFLSCCADEVVHRLISSPFDRDSSGRPTMLLVTSLQARSSRLA